MREFVEYACIHYHGETDVQELVYHLSMNGYDFGIDKSRCLLFVLVDDVDYVETILDDRNILYHTREF